MKNDYLAELIEKISAPGYKKPASFKEYAPYEFPKMCDIDWTKPRPMKMVIQHAFNPKIVVIVELPV